MEPERKEGEKLEKEEEKKRKKTQRAFKEIRFEEGKNGMHGTLKYHKLVERKWRSIRRKERRKRNTAGS